MNIFHITGVALAAVILIPLLVTLGKRYFSHRRIERQKDRLRGSWE